MTLPTAAIEQTFISLSSACGGPSDLWIREVLPVGWGDTYSSGFVEQHFDVTDLPNGTYYIKITANPNKNVAEVANDDANVSYRRVELGGEPGLRTVRIPPYQGIDTESFISEFGSSQFSD